MNRYLNRTALSSLQTVDLIAWLVEALNWTQEDEHVLSQLRKIDVPLLLLISKVDKVKDKNQLLPYIQEITAKHTFVEVFPISTFKKDNLSELETSFTRYLPTSPFLFPTDQVTDRSERFLSAEIIREKLIYALGAELPYRISVQIELFNSEETITRIHAIIWVERRSQKAIIIGKQGTMLKSIGEQARKEMETLLGMKVFLQLWVKVKEDWSDNERALRQLGYT
jgi:GTP-binding protein Era